MLFSFVYGDISMTDNKYRFNILNEKLVVPNEVNSYADIANLIETQYGYRVITKVDEIDKEKKFVDLSKFTTIGEIFDNLLNGYDAVIDVQKSKIMVVYPEHVYIDLPYGWDILKAKNAFERKFSNIRFYIAGNRISAYGLPYDLSAITPYLKEYLNYAYKKYHIYVRIYPYCTTEAGTEFIGKRKSTGSEEFSIIKQIDSKITHGDKINVSYENINMNFLVDVQNENVIYDGQSIPLSKFSEYGFVFKINGPSQSMFDIGALSDKSKACSDVIVVLDLSESFLM
jgi:hypothetical protein